MKSIFFIAFLLFQVVHVKAQNGVIKGKVSNSSTGMGEAGAMVVLYKTADSSLEKIEVSDNEGKFSFINIPEVQYFVEIKGSGFATYQSATIDLAKGPVPELEIKLSPVSKVLETVVVSAKKPLIERKLDKVVMNVEASLTAAGTSALEVLEKAPGVEVDKDGKISLKGKDGVLVLIDDRPTYLKGDELANYLKNLPSSSLDKLEIMTNPSAKYDAAGNSGVINIKTKKMKSRGFNGSLNTSAMVSDDARGNGSLNLNYRKGKINLFGTYSYFFMNTESTMFLKRNFTNYETQKLEATFDQQNTTQFHAESNNAKVGLDFYAGKNTVAGIVLTGNYATRLRHYQNKAKLLNPYGETDSVLSAHNNFNGYSKNFSANMNLRHSFDSSGKNITVDLDYIVYDQNSNSNIFSEYFYGDGSVQKPSALLIGRMPSHINIYSGKSDYTMPFKNGSKIEAGIKSSYVVTDNNALYQNQTDKGFETDNHKTNHFIYKENINAAYINWNMQVKKWGFQSGLRAEQTIAKGHQLGNTVYPDSSFTKNYVNLFPTVYVSYNANEKNSFAINYGRRIERPEYNDLNPFLYFIDEYTYEAGNVFLQPEFTDQVEISHTYNNFLNSSISYSHTNNSITETLRQETEKRITYQTKDNIAEKTSITFSSGANFSVGKKIRVSIDGSLSDNIYSGMIEQQKLHTETWTFRGKMSNQVKFANGWSAELSGFYSSRAIEGQIVIDPLWRADAAVQKSILKNKGSLNLFIRDIFNSQQFNGSVKSNEIDVLINHRRQSRIVGISFSYRFGKPIKNLKQHRSGSTTEEVKRVGGD